MTDPAYRTISDVATLVGVPHHVLRFWETKFPVIAPMKRGGNRRYYRPADVAAIARIARLLHVEGYTIKGAQKLLAADDAAPARHAGAGRNPVALPDQPAEPGMRLGSGLRPNDDGGPGDRGPSPASAPLAAIAAIRADLAAGLAAARRL